MSIKDKYFGAVYDRMKKKHNISTAFAIAKKAADSYEVPSMGTKSVSFLEGGNPLLDTITLGYPGMDVQALSGGVLLDPQGWEKQSVGVITGDYEHIHADKLEGKRVDVDEIYHSFIAKANNVRFDAETNVLLADVSFPEHPKTEEIKERYENGELGISVEYAGDQETIEYEEIGGELVPVLRDWIITGFTFTENPSYEGTKKE